ncbi:hydrogenase maturation protease [Thermoflexus sp.]|uniref:hydrogenase maturation protease n=1 Tax=Thermoflexus sp. TaxID=1969742 RepID=UPI0025FE2058|nr:hydrogenase maturation protease [Thermoflexus sp.]MDW8179892.1 hydrogenase maturation protease [Anaerolineae bacterium]MCS6963289.1 hydrogenase maturation protease [Thermoflexus sp.]MCS7350441.1 hydrogenase maturation protease [Thermoflexus sp.]MCX7689368.1 hydrogenase maturation protease [Thermoflexus sp.]MDW8183958.1 hydrogenase maturation protease [Anaerolineae bacterium]
MRPLLALIGLGNAWRRDDGVGLWVAEQIQARNLQGLKVAPLSIPDPVALARAWEGARIVWIVDAVRAGRPPGTVLRLRWDRLPDPQERWCSTHGIPIQEAIPLARALGDPPASITVYGIVGRDFGHGEGFTPEVEAGAHRLLRRLERLIPHVLRCLDHSA